MKIYPYRTTLEKWMDGTAERRITEAGDTVISAHCFVGRDWILVCRKGAEQTVAEMTGSELRASVADLTETFAQIAADVHAMAKRVRL